MLTPANFMYNCKINAKVIQIKLLHMIMGLNLVLNFCVDDCKVLQASDSGLHEQSHR